jgi:hypothetical protein
MEFDDRLRVKSAAGGGGGALEDVPPQLALTNASERSTAAGTPWRNRPMK